MQTRTRNALAMGAAAGVAAAVLVVVARREKPPVAGARALDAIPSGALLVATADLTALRASPVGAPFLREGREIKGVGKVRDVCGFDPLDALTEVAVAIPAAGDAGEFGLVAAGAVDDDALLACASKVIEARGGRPATTQIGSFRSVRDTSLATSGGEIAVRKGGPLLLGAGTYLRAMVDAADGHAPTIKSSVAHGALGQAVGPAPLRVTVVLTPEQRKTLAEELASNGAAGDPAGSIRAAALGVSLRATVSLHAVLMCETAPACAAVANRLAETRDARAHDLALRLAGFGSVLERIAIEATGETVHARVELPSEEAATLVERVLALRGLKHPMPTDHPTDAPHDRPDQAPSVRADEVVRPDAGASRRSLDAGAGAPR